MLNDTIYSKTIESPVGKLHLLASDKGLMAVLFDGKDNARLRYDNIVPAPATSAIMAKAEKQFAEYFSGKRNAFDLPLDVRGTIFQKKAWKELQKIPYGQTISYGEQAKRMGDPNKSRAVGAANGRNPLSIVVPCHRVIGSSGALTGFGGGMEAKEFLLKLEGALLSEAS